MEGKNLRFVYCRAMLFASTGTVMNFAAIVCMMKLFVIGAYFFEQAIPKRTYSCCTGCGVAIAGGGVRGAA